MNPVTKPRILLVDDDINLRAAFKRTLSKAYLIDTAGDGEAALHALKRRSDYQVVIVDMNMPGMSGLKLLAHAQRVSPDTVRIMLTGAAEQQVAADALNKGRVFRFLHKPCSGSDFLAAMSDALEYYREVRQEREAFARTFQGVITVLTEVLSAVEPAAFGRGQHLAQRALKIAAALNVASTWEIEAAAMLLRVGMVTIPGPVLQRYNAGSPMSRAEQEMIERIPETGANLLAHVPHLAPVATIVRYHRKRFDGSGPPADAIRGDDLPVGARIFCALLDMEAHELRGMPPSEALRQLERTPERYDPHVLRALTASVAELQGAESATMYLTATELKPGQILGEHALSDEGIIIIPKSTTLTEFLIDRLRNFAETGELQEPLTVLRPLDDAEADTSAKEVETPA